MDKRETKVVCRFNRGTVLTDASRILPETTCQVPLTPHQWGTVDISKIINNCVNILNQFYATDFAFCHVAANYYTSVTSNFMKTSEFSVPADFLFFLGTRVKVHYKCTKSARLHWSRQGESDARNGTAFCLCQCKMRKCGHPNLIQNKKRYTMKSTNQFRYFSRKARCMW